MVRGIWNKDLVVGKPRLNKPKAQLDIRQRQTYDHIANLVSMVNGYFGSPVHHFGGDEVAYMWDSHDDNKLFSDFLNWLHGLLPNKSLVLWDDPLTDEEKNVNISKDWIIQTWHNGVTQDILNRGHRVIVSESETFYIGNSDEEKISSFQMPNNPNVLGFELVWFTSEGDNPNDFHEDWVMDSIKACSRIRKPTSGY